MDYTTLSAGQVRAALEQIARDAGATFGHLDAQQVNWRPDTGGWSVAQCFAHLLIANRLMLDGANRALDASQPRTIWQRLPVLPRVFGPMLIRSQAPTTTRKFSAARAAQPASSDVAPDVIDRFVEQHREAAAWVGTLDERAAAARIMTSPFARVITYSVLDGCRLMVAHDHRHLEQARRVIASPAFPGARGIISGSRPDPES